MLHYRRVLCAVDFSKESIHVAARAQVIADRANATLSFVHVLENTPMAYGGGEYTLPVDMSLSEVLREHAEHTMEKLLEELNIDEVDSHLIDGSIKHGVVDLAKRLNSDLVVVGCHGHHGMGMLMGGNANGILHAAPCDVLAVHID